MFQVGASQPRHTLHHLVLSEGQVLIREGAAAKEFIVIADGIAEVTRETASGAVTVANVASGDFLGEMGLLNARLRAATVTATSDLSVFVCSASEFRSMLRLAPPWPRRSRRSRWSGPRAWPSPPERLEVWASRRRSPRCGAARSPSARGRYSQSAGRHMAWDTQVRHLRGLCGQALAPASLPHPLVRPSWAVDLAGAHGNGPSLGPTPSHAESQPDWPRRCRLGEEAAARCSPHVLPVGPTQRCCPEPSEGEESRLTVQGVARARGSTPRRSAGPRRPSRGCR